MDVEVDFALDELPGDRLHDVLRELRGRGPVQPTRFLGLPAFVITGHRALLEAFTDPERFPPHRMYQVAFEGAIGETFISTPDPERHRVLRKWATPAFRSRAVDRFASTGLAELADELIDGFDAREVDLVADFAARFPYLIISRLLGLPREREAEFHRWALALLRFRDEPAEAAVAGRELTAYLAPVVAARRTEPRGDVISALVAEPVDGRTQDDETIQSHVRLLFPTGGETTHGALGNLCSLLLRREGDWPALRADPSRIPLFVEEALRFETPIAVLPRMSAAYPIHFHGVEIPADSWVLFAIAAANRDPEVFDNPDRFDPDRPERDSLSFGRGAKSCPGMHLARRNMTVALERLLHRLPDPTLVDPEAALPRRTVLRSPDALRVELQP